MAAHVDSFGRQFREHLALLRPFPGRLEFSGRLALACALTTLVAEIYQTPDPALTAYVAFFVMKRDRMESVILSIVLSVLISLLVGMLILIAMAVIDQPLWRVISISVASFGLLFLASASKLKPLAAIIALIVGYAMDLLSDAPVGELATRGYLYAWLFVTIPAGVSIALNLLLGPPPRRLLEDALARRLALAASLMRDSDEKVREAFRETLSEGVTELKTWRQTASSQSCCWSTSPIVRSPCPRCSAARLLTRSTRWRRSFAREDILWTLRSRMAKRMYRRSRPRCLLT
jgi:multidrug resistance protein MdtO